MQPPYDLDTEHHVGIRRPFRSAGGFIARMSVSGVGIHFGRSSIVGPERRNRERLHRSRDRIPARPDARPPCDRWSRQAELFTTGGDRINPRFPNFAGECFRIRPTRIVSWGMEGGTTSRDFRLNARSVG